jgi:hypothetical protein
MNGPLFSGSTVRLFLFFLVFPSVPTFLATNSDDAISCSDFSSRSHADLRVIAGITVLLTKSPFPVDAWQRTLSRSTEMDQGEDETW